MPINKKSVNKCATALQMSCGFCAENTSKLFWMADFNPMGYNNSSIGIYGTFAEINVRGGEVC